MHIPREENSKNMLSQLKSEHASINRPGFKKFRIVLIKPSKYDPTVMSFAFGKAFSRATRSMFYTA